MKIKKIWECAFVTFCLIAMSILLIRSIRQESPTYDEVTYAEYGNHFLVDHDFRYDPFSPPLAKEIVALPTLVNKNVIYDRVIFWPRMMTVVFTLGLAVLVYLFSKKLFGESAAKLSLLLFVFEPNLLANGHYANADLIFTFFYILSLFLFWLWRKTFTYKKIIIFSIVTGLLLSTKITSIPFFIFPVIILYVLDIKRKQDLIKYSFWKKIIWPLLAIFFVMAITLWSTYFFKFEPPLGYRFDKNRPAIALSKTNPLIKLALTVPVPLGSYISTIKQAYLYNYSNIYIKRSYILGMASDFGSPGYYFPLVFFIKTPLPLLILFALCLLVPFKYVKRDKYILVPLLFIFLNVILSYVTLVNRYILPVYPLVIIYAGQTVNIKMIRKKIFYIFLGVLLIWFIMGTLKTFPYFVSYMNETIGGSGNRYKYLVDANYDWGQGLIALKKYEDIQGTRNLQLAYFGSVDPSKYGISYEKIKNLAINDNKNTAALKFDKNHTIAISATCWYFCGYYKDPAFSKSRPIDIVGGSILIFNKQ
jgi:hypothetical protein